MTYFVQRDSSGNITGLFTNPQPGFAEESKPDTDAQVATFLRATATP